MKGPSFCSFTPVVSLLLLSSLPYRVLANEVLETTSFSTCLDSTAITVNNVAIVYDATIKTVTFDVSGTSNAVHNVTATLNVTAYGHAIYSNSFSPCDTASYVADLCPLPSGSFSGTGTQVLPDAYAAMIPSIAFSVPDIEAIATLELKDVSTGDDVACIEAQISNGKTTQVAAVSWVAASVLLASLAASGIAAALTSGLAASGGGASAAASAPSSPGIGNFMNVFHGIATIGMRSINTPEVLRSFTKNFGFSVGIIPFTKVQTFLDSVRQATGGNLTDDNVQYLQNATLAFSGSTDSVSKRMMMERAMGEALLFARNTLSSRDNTTTSDADSENLLTVSGIEAFVESLAVPKSNAFLTILLTMTIITVLIGWGVALFKGGCEIYDKCFGLKKFEGFRKHWMGTIGRLTVTLMTMMLQIWTMYSIFEIAYGDSWLFKVIAGVTLFVFLATMALFSWRIWRLAREMKNTHPSGLQGLVYDKQLWLKYSNFYDSYEIGYYWIFMPTLLYNIMFGIVMAATNEKSMIQTVLLAIIEVLFLLLLIFLRPFVRRSGNAVNIFIQIVRVLSSLSCFVFIDELEFQETTSSITGMVLIVLNGVLTGALVIALAVNTIVNLIKDNPHRKRRKEAEKLNRDLDDLTPLDARNSLLLVKPSGPHDHHRTGSLTSSQSYTQDVKAMSPLIQTHSSESLDEHANAVPMMAYRERDRDLTPQARSMRHLHSESMDNLVDSAAPMDGSEVGHQKRSGGGGYRGIRY